MTPTRPTDAELENLLQLIAVKDSAAEAYKEAKEAICLKHMLDKPSLEVYLKGKANGDTKQAQQKLDTLEALIEGISNEG